MRTQRQEEALEFIRSNPKMFVGDNPPTEALLTKYLLEGVLLLTENQVVTCRRDGWRIIAAEDDWLTLGRHQSERSVFLDVVQFPELGVNCCRPEVAMAAFAQDVVTASDEGWTNIQGAPMDAEMMARLRDELPRWRRLVAFRMSKPLVSLKHPEVLI
ncbi:MAG: hypothetical protein ABIY70_29095 [Capsulimonas sp.]|uniref:hypothetical protein n=1 Tax=Capsulimonas sp. TaxID=2494211 RepID=UPI003265A247